MGSLFRWSHSLPVERSQDIAKKGKGVIEFDDPLNIRGIGTQFQKEFQPGDSIKFIVPAKEHEVEEQIIERILSDTEIILKSPGAKFHNPNI